MVGLIFCGRANQLWFTRRLDRLSVPKKQHLELVTSEWFCSELFAEVTDVLNILHDHVQPVIRDSNSCKNLQKTSKQSSGGVLSSCALGHDPTVVGARRAAQTRCRACYSGAISCSTRKALS